MNRTLKSKKKKKTQKRRSERKKNKTHKTESNNFCVLSWIRVIFAVFAYIQIFCDFEIFVSMIQ